MTKVLQLIVALSFVLYLCYARLFRRFYDLNFAANTLQIQEFFSIFVVIFVISISLTILLAWTIYMETRRNTETETESKFKIILNLITIPSNYLIKWQISLYTTVFDMVGPLGQQYLVLFAKKFLESVYLRNMFYFGMVFPRIIIIICLIMELYCGHLKYYYCALLLLIIPLIIQFLVFILKDIGPRLYPVFSDHLIFTKVATEPNKSGDLFFIKMTLKPEYSDMDLDRFMYELYYPMLYLPGTLETDFLPKYNNLRKYSLFFYYLIHSFCWGYVLIVYFL